VEVPKEVNLAASNFDMSSENWFNLVREKAKQGRIRDSIHLSKNSVHLVKGLRNDAKGAISPPGFGMTKSLKPKGRSKDQNAAMAFKHFIVN
jgi:hypothetical protein